MFKQITVLLIALSFLWSCSEDKVVEPDPIASKIEVHEVNQLSTFKAETADTITYYNLRTNNVVASSEATSTNWDIAFYRTTLYANHGQYGPGNGGLLTVANTDFTYLLNAPTDGYLDVLSGSATGWYNYDFTNHTVSPKPGLLVVIKCADGKYAKMQILSYYKGYPDNIPSVPEEREDKYYSFKYSIQMNGSNSFE